MLSYELRSIHSLLDTNALHADTLALLQDLDVKHAHLAMALKTYYEAETGIDWSAANCPSCDLAGAVAVFAPVPPSAVASCACECIDKTIVQLDACATCATWQGARAVVEDLFDSTIRFPSTTVYLHDDCSFSIEFYVNALVEPGYPNYWYFAPGTEDAADGVQGAQVPVVSGSPACIRGSLPAGHTWDSLAGTTNKVTIWVYDKALRKLKAVVERPSTPSQATFSCAE